MSYDHERPNSLNPSEWEYSVIAPDGATILISKVGGGTLGKPYDGTWHYSYSLRDEHSEGSDLETPIPVSHATAADYVFGFMGHDA
jgi:hypothetical protein